MRLSADPTGEIDELVEALESAHSPWRKVKVLAHAWKTVRKLRPDERFLVAKHVGLEGAEVFLEKLGDPYRGLPAEELLDIVRTADAEDFERWKGIVGRLRQSEYRGGILRKGVEQVRGVLLEKSALPPETETSESRDATPLVPAPENEALPAEVEAGLEPESEIVAALPQAESTASEALPEAPKPQVDVVETAVEKRPEAGARPSAERTIEALTASPSTLTRLRRFNRLLEAMRPFEREALVRLLDQLPAGWVRRRGLTRLLESGIPEDLEDALGLIDLLEKPFDRRWCLRALVDSRSFAPDEKEAVLTRAASSAERKRLANRLGS